MLSFLLPLTCSERCDTKPLTRSNQVRPRDAQTKKQLTAAQPASSKSAGSSAGTARHREAPTGAKKTAKTTVKAASQTKANPRNNNNTNRGNGKFSWSRVTVLAWALHVIVNFILHHGVKCGSSILSPDFPIPLIVMANLFK